MNPMHILHDLMLGFGERLLNVGLLLLFSPFRPRYFELLIDARVGDAAQAADWQQLAGRDGVVLVQECFRYGSVKSFAAFPEAQLTHLR